MKKKVLILNLNLKPLALDEFVYPLVKIIKEKNFIWIIKHYIKHYKELNLKTLNQYEACIIAGTPLKEKTYLEHLNKFKWIKKCPIPLLGVCAGMQIIGALFKANLIRCKEIGLIEINLVNQDKIFENKISKKENKLKVYTLHTLALKPTQAFLKKFFILAKSKKAIQIIKHKQRPIYGMLFHPEARNKWLVERFLEF